MSSDSPGVVIPRARSNNRIVNNSNYGRILREYNARLERDGKVNDKQFYEDVVAGLIPGYTLNAWYNFIRRFRTTAGLVAANVVATMPHVPPAQAESEMVTTLLTNTAATQKGIQAALNIGAKRLQEILDNPHLLTGKEAIDLLFKAMKAQDSRIHAVGKIREDNREQAKFDRAFSAAAYD